VEDKGPSLPEAGARPRARRWSAVCPSSWRNPTFDVHEQLLRPIY